MNENPQQQLEPVVLEKKSYLQRVFGMFTGPKEVFQYIDEKPEIILALLIPVLGTVMISIAAIVQNFRNPQYLEAMKQMPETMSNVMKYGASVIGAIFGVVFVLIILLVQAGIIHVIAPFLNGKGTFKKLVCVLGYSSAPGLILGILSLIYIVVNQTDYIPFSASLGLFFTQEKVGLFWHSLCQSIDLFAFWSMGLAILGISIIYKFNWKKAAAIILAFWLIGVGISLGFVKVFEPFYNKAQQVQVDETESSE
ncbi:MAG: Yip1 family protein [bacterium]|nr:Yip1 family protein [bacterium]